jgi:phosphoglycolate phosphatase-like HAD superfamily hydrolase
LVIFDLDGTLTDSARGIVSSFRYALDQVGVPVPDDVDLAPRVVGPPMHHTLRGMGLGEKTDTAIAAYRADYTTRGWVLKKILAHFGLDDHFEVIAGASLDGVRATKSDVIAHALAQLDPVPDHVLMVGDRAHDVAGASHHGIDTVVVEWGYGSDDFAEPAVDQPAKRVATVAALREVLGV